MFARRLQAVCAAFALTLDYLGLLGLTFRWLKREETPRPFGIYTA